MAEMLARRDARRAGQQALQDETGCPVLSLTVVSPGPIKNGPEIWRCFVAAREAVEAELAARRWPVLARRDVNQPTGPEMLLAVRAPAVALKRAMVRVEDTQPWGRLWDIDVVVNMRPLTRDDVGALPRRCLVCPGPAVDCARSRRHGLDAVLAAVASVMDGWGGGRPGNDGNPPRSAPQRG